MDIAEKKTTLSPSEHISEYIEGLPDWRGEALTLLRKMILEADSGIVEQWKWGSPVWSRGGMVCSGSAFKDHVKLNFFSGASLNDPHHLFNAGLEAKVSRSIDFFANDEINYAAVKELVETAIAFNLAAKHKD
jgi:hypothetical protein